MNTRLVFDAEKSVSKAVAYAEVRRDKPGGMAYTVPLVPPEKLEHGLRLYAITGPRPADGYAYRYSDGIRFNNGEDVNGSKPHEAVPYWLGA